MDKLKCGIEIHQRLDTKRKLFCACGAGIENASADATVKRRLSAVRGEMGQMDPAAKFEGERAREHEYKSCRDSSCLVDLDEEPPFPLNEEALETALQVAKALHSQPVDEIHVMRKTVVDGSATSGFQRTALIAVGGFVETALGKVGIQSVCLEEESCGIDGHAENGSVYRLDRLGVPLVEIATEPDIISGEQAKETAQKIGMTLRSTGKVQRGIGSIRQDLNISVSGGARVEIKGAQELDALGALVENEAKRQVALWELAKKAKADGAEPAADEAQADVTELLSAVKTGFIPKAIERGDAAVACRVAGLAGVLGKELLEGHRFGTEMSQYAKAAAGVGGIIHSDEQLQEKYGITHETAAQIAKAVACKAKDAWILCIAPKNRTQKALLAACGRAAKIGDGVQKETRRAAGEKSEFMRPLPGSARMYPETDVPPVPIDADYFEGIEIPESFEEKSARYSAEYGLPADASMRMAREFPEAFETCAKTGADPLFVATTLSETVTAIRRKGSDTGALTQSALAEFFEAYKKGKFTKAAATPLLEALCRGETAASALGAGLTRLTKAQVARLAAEYAKKAPGAKKQELFAAIIREHRLTVDAADLQSALCGQ